jgi:hypothetical protein
MIPTFLKEVWDLMGPKVRRFVLGVVGFALVCILVMFAFLYWYTGEMHNRFGFLPTTKDLNEQTDKITGAMATKDEVAEIGHALYAYQDSLGRLRKAVDSTLIAPGLVAIVDLQRRMAKLERGQVETKLAIEDQKRQGQQSTVELIYQMNRNSSAEARAKEQEARADKEQRERDRELMEAIAKKLKIETKNF